MHSPRHGCRDDGRAEDFRQPLHTLAPLVAKLIIGQGEHSGGMAERVAAYRVTPVVKLFDLFGCEESGPSDKPCGHEEMAPPSLLVQRWGYMPVRACPPIVERENDRNAVENARPIYDRPDSGKLERVQVFPEVGQVH